MATTTPNFGWDIPQSTDLVKDGATAIAALGNDIDTSMVDLKGGTTGQVLSKASNTDMDFSWINNDQGDITGVTAGTGLTGGGTSGAVTLDFDVANYGGGQWAAGKNKIINGDFRIWQRGTTFNSVTNGQYCADRWTVGKDGTNTVNVTQQSFTAGTAPVSGYESQYFIRGSIATTGTLTFFQFAQAIEDVRTFAGQTITVSFWAKGSGTATGLVYAEQNFGSGGSAAVETGYPTYSLTTSWARYSVQLTLPSISGKTIGTSSMLKIFIRSGLTANGSTFDLWGVQVEAGSVATPFQTATGTIQGELQAAQRYYIRWNDSNAYSSVGFAMARASTNANALLPLPTKMRIAPTSVEYANMELVNGGTAFAISAGGVAIYTSLNSALTAVLDITSTGMTTGAMYYIRQANNAAGYIGISAEL